MKWLLCTESADFSPTYNHYGQCCNWTSQHRILSKSTATSVRSVEKLKHRQYWDSHSNYRNLSPLAHAVVGGHFEIARLLLDLGHRDQGTPDGEGRSLLHYAAQGGSLDIAKLLFSTGIYDLNAADIHGDTVLSYAVRNNQMKVLEWLVDHADLTCLSKGNVWESGRTPLSLGIQYADKEIVMILINSKRVNLTSRDRRGRTPLSYASQHADASVLQLLIDSGVVLDSRDRFDQSPLHYAAKRSDPSIIRLLLKYGALEVPGQESLWKPTTHSFAARLGYYGRRKASRDITSYAAQYSDVSVLKLFIDPGVLNMNSRDKSGRNTFSHAVLNSEASVVKLLVESGALVHGIITLDGQARTLLSCASHLCFYALHTVPT